MRCPLLLLLLPAISMSACPAWTFAGGGPHDVAVVVNQDSWASVAVANHYIHSRGIPSCNVFYLEGVDSYEQMDVQRFRETILRPLLEKMESRGVRDQIEVIAYSADFPYAINVRGDLKQVDPKRVPKVLTPVGSLTGMTFLYDRVLAAPSTPQAMPGYLQLNSNRYYQRFGSKLPPVPESVTEDLQKALASLRAGDVEAAEGLLRKVVAMAPTHPMLLYNLACSLARQEQMEKLDEAVSVLKKSVANGWGRADMMRADNDLKSLRERADFQALVKSIKMKFESEPTQPFQNAAGWDAQGNPAPDDPSAERYFLSTMLGMTSGRGNSVDEALVCIDRSVSSDGNPPQGTIYFPTNGNVRSRTRQHLFPSVVAQLKAQGVSAESSPGVIPKQKEDVAGAMIGAASFDWEQSKSQILPGAICEHLTSFGGVLREAAGQTPLTEFIRHGAVGSSGTVTEPYAIQAKFPTAFLHLHYTAGCNLAEAFYQSVAGPYQLLIVGDPLCQPWADKPSFEVKSPVFEADSQPWSEPFPVRVVEAERPRKAPETLRKTECSRIEYFVDGRRMATAGPNTPTMVAVESLADGPHRLSVVAVRGNSSESQDIKSTEFRVRRHAEQVTLKLHADAADETKEAKETKETKETKGVHRTATSEPLSVAYAASLRISATARGAEELVVYRDHQELGRADGSEVSMTVKASKLGLGYSRIWAEATFANDRRSVTAVRRCFVQRPSSFAAKSPPKKRKEGLQLKWADGEVDLVATTRANDWLAGLGREEGSDFESVAWFHVKEEPGRNSNSGMLHQLQLRSNGRCSIEVDGKLVLSASEDRWYAAPLVLEPGHHQFTIRGEVAEKPRLSIRFGRRGAMSLDGRFQHAIGE